MSKNIQSPCVAVLTFPGNNCEVETLRSIKKVGLLGEIFLWNRTPEELEEFDGVIVPGGFSFEDRGRSGIISAQEPVIQTLKKMANLGKPILGICNGAQIVVESGLILETPEKIPMVALSRNKRKNETGEVLGTGFYHSWRNLNVKNTKTPFSNFSGKFSGTFKIPLAHGEGRFVFPKEIEKEVLEKNLIVFQYTDEEGSIDNHYPINPNGSFLNAAGVCNPAGNVVALMPHPERTEAGIEIFKSLKTFLDTIISDKNSSNKLLNNQKNIDFSFKNREEISEKILKNSIKNTVNNSIEFFVQLKITDKTEKTFENVVQKKFQNPEISLTRQVKWGVQFSDSQVLTSKEKLSRAKKIITSNELLNINKESVIVKVEDIYYKFSVGVFTKITPKFSSENSFETRENEDFVGESKKLHFEHLFPEYLFEKISHGIMWSAKGVEKKDLLKTPLFASFVGETVFSV